MEQQITLVFVTQEADTTAEASNDLFIGPESEPKSTIA
jgi:hypothetical protein